MKSRIITAILGIPVIFLILWAGYPWIWIAFSVVSSIAILEFYGLNPSNRPIPVKIVGVFWLNMLLASNYLLNVALIDILILGLVGIPIINFFLQIIVFCTHKFNRPFKLKQQFSYSLHTLVGIIYIGLPTFLLLDIRNEINGFELLAIIIFGVFVTDTFSFFTGKLIGTRKLAPTISPSKTWEGAIGGVATAITIAILNYYVFNLPIQIGHLLGLSIIVPILSMTGDLAESSLKRWVHTKEAGALFPGHGGILDRIDSLVLIFPLVYYVQSVWLT